MLKGANKRWREGEIFMVKDKNYKRNFIWETKHNRVFQNSYQGPSLTPYLSRVLVSGRMFCQKTKTKKNRAPLHLMNELSNTENKS